MIEVQDAAESLPGETILVNLHGALISTSAQLNIGMRISVYVYLQTNVPRPWSFTSILRTRCAAESSWTNHKTSGGCLSLRTTGKRECRFTNQGG